MVFITKQRFRASILLLLAVILFTLVLPSESRPHPSSRATPRYKPWELIPTKQHMDYIMATSKFSPIFQHNFIVKLGKRSTQARLDSCIRDYKQNKQEVNQATVVNLCLILLGIKRWVGKFGCFQKRSSSLRFIKWKPKTIGFYRDIEFQKESAQSEV